MIRQIFRKMIKISYLNCINPQISSYVENKDEYIGEKNKTRTKGVKKGEKIIISIHINKSQEKDI